MKQFKFIVIFSLLLVFIYMTCSCSKEQLSEDELEGYLISTSSKDLSIGYLVEQSGYTKGPVLIEDLRGTINAEGFIENLTLKVIDVDSRESIYYIYRRQLESLNIIVDNIDYDISSEYDEINIISDYDSVMNGLKMNNDNSDMIYLERAVLLNPHRLENSDNIRAIYMNDEDVSYLNDIEFNGYCFFSYITEAGEKEDFTFYVFGDLVQ